MNVIELPVSVIEQLRAYDVDPARGFLPSEDPLAELPREFGVWEEVAQALPKLIASDRARRTISDIPVTSASGLRTKPELERAMLLLSYLGHAYVWEGATVSARLPAGVAVPWRQLSSRLGRPPVLAYASHALNNWRRFDVTAPIALGNLARQLNFCGGTDEDWFVLVHIEIEAKAAPAIVSMFEAKEAIARDDLHTCEAALTTIAATVTDMLGTLKRMPERCDPYIYYTRVRPWIFGWYGNVALPQGVFYSDGTEGGGESLFLRGETGAQSSIIPAADALCGILYAADPLREHLLALRTYMPMNHRRFVEFLESGESMRSYLLKRKERARGAIDAFNATIRALAEFRSQHLEYAGMYIHRQSQRENSNPTAVGTGGTPFMKYLQDHERNTEQHLIA